MCTGWKTMRPAIEGSPVHPEKWNHRNFWNMSVYLSVPPSSIYLPTYCLSVYLSIYLCTQSFTCVWLSVTPWKPTRLLCLWDFPGNNTGVGNCFLLQGIFQIQGSSLGLLHLLLWQVDSLSLSHQGSLCIDVCIHKIQAQMVLPD